MKRIILFLVFLLIFVPSSLAQVSIEVSKSYLTIFSDEYQVVDLIIHNYQEKTDTFQINVIPSSLQKVSAFSDPINLAIGANSIARASIYFHAHKDAPQTISPLVFEVTVTSLSDPTITTSEKIKITVLRKSPLYISELRVEKTVYDPGEVVRISTEISNTANKPSEEYVLETVIEKENEIIKRFQTSVVNVPAESSRNYLFEYNLGKYAPYGTYSVISTLKDKTFAPLYEERAYFKVRAISRLPAEYTEKQTEVKFLAVYVTIRVKNEGNIGTGEFYVTESIPLIAKDFFSPEIEPTNKTFVNGKIVYAWLVPSLEPGEEIVIRYQFVLWKAYIILAIIIIAVYLAFKYVFAVSLIKSYPSGPIGRGKETRVILEIRNKSLKEINSVEVRDFVPSEFKLIEKFDTVKPHSIKHTQRGSGLIWKFDSIRAGESRVLVYRIKPLVEMEKLKLPYAALWYITTKGEKRKVFSHNVLK
jgi:hypothetical protein